MSCQYLNCAIYKPLLGLVLDGWPQASIFWVLKSAKIYMNFDPLLSKIKNNLDKWRPLKWFLWGKVNVIKMVMTPWWSLWWFYRIFLNSMINYYFCGTVKSQRLKWRKSAPQGTEALDYHKIIYLLKTI